MFIPDSSEEEEREERCDATALERGSPMVVLEVPVERGCRSASLVLGEGGDVALSVGERCSGSCIQ